jgi:hypothetical protein
LKTAKKALAALAVGAVAAVGVAVNAAPASAGSASSSYYYPGGNRLEANVWIQSIADARNCGNWATSAKLWGNNPPTAEWIKNVASFHANGIGAEITGSSGGVSVGGSGVDVSMEWTNDNNWISDLAGNLCANWLTWYVSAGSTAVSFVPKYGSPRSASAGV